MPPAALNVTPVLRGLLAEHAPALAQAEDLPLDALERAVAEGRMVLLANPAHRGVAPTLIGQPARVKVNANIGTSPLIDDPAAEDAKLRAAEDAGADTLMDLSTAGDLDAIRRHMLTASALPLGTVPIYAVARRVMDGDGVIEDMRAEDLLEEIEKQARQGVDFMTLHMGVTRRAAALAADRVLGIVSRGGSMTARWMDKHGAENPLYDHAEDIFAICREHNVTISLGDGLRPGAGADAGDAAQWEEVVVLSELTKRAWAAGVQIMVEGPGHVPMHQVAAQIRGIKELCHGAPLYVLGPLVTDSAPGYDHIAGAVGGAIAALNGADFLCYVTPAEHLTLPDAEDVRQGVMASRIAAAGAEAALGRPWAVARDLAISQARRQLDWQAMTEHAMDPAQVCARRGEHAGEKECAMCGKFCAVRMVDESL